VKDVGALWLVWRVLKVFSGIDEDVMTAAEEVDPLRAVLVECRSNGKAKTCSRQFNSRYTTRCARRDAVARGMVG
jgi:hypothetical protein